ncbi:YjcQ family protein [Viridibacillus arvi]|uniref:YjcQ family protein n=1 Tax=Viridibacillus arvi TaxID=263475 RepID=UPI0036A65D56
MSNDTLDVILAILKYLDESMDEERIDFSKVNAEALGVNEPRYNRILSMMIDEGYVTGLTAVPIAGQTYVSYKAIDPRPTMYGIQTLNENTMTAKAVRIAKGIKEFIPGF